MEAPIMKN